MSKSKRELKKEEERRIIAEMEAGLQETRAAQENGAERENLYGDDLPQILHCKRCKTVLQAGVCPVCGFKIYVPLDKKKRERTKKILTVVFLVGFALVLLLLQINKS